MRAVLAAGVLLTGCFYIDPIIPRPRVSIDRPQAIYRGGSVTLTARFDSDSKPGQNQWALYSCLAVDSPPRDGCDQTSFISFRPDEVTPYDAVTFMVPLMTKDKGGKTGAIRVELVARSDRGAIALLESNNEFPVADAPPDVDLAAQSHSLAAGAPIDLVATYGDVDDDVDGVALTWTVSGPSSNYTLEDLAIPDDPGDPSHRKVGKRLTPDIPGTWAVEVTATDPEMTANRASRTFTVLADRPPCLAQWSPVVPPAGATLPVSARTLFQVPLVDDDLDAYPPITDASQFGTTAFAWSILPPGATEHQPVPGANLNRFAFDPASFTPGDIVELRVEIADRSHALPLPCDDTAATCSIASSASCLQRQTWRVEVR
ncbi:MAG TPA: hypothetical protein VHW23_20540 [Kofleriaceae bacterium]|nr:hypothetical protein [Kofleriaceae bacterium]